MLSRRALVSLSALLPLLAACGMELPISERIINVRPLGVKVEASSLFTPEPEGAASRAEALPVDDITITPFFVDDQGPLDATRIEQEIEPVWLACPLQPLQGVFSCLTAQLPLTLDEIEVCPPVDFAALDPSSGELPAVPTPCRLDGGTPAQPSMQVPLDFNFFLGGDLELTMIGHRPEADTTTERCAQALLEEEPLPSECLVQVQRASIGPDSAILQLAADAGFEGLDQLGTIPEEIPDADRNTRIQTFQVVITDEQDIRAADLTRVFEEGTPIDVARGDTLEVSAEQTLVIQTTAPEDDLQTYLIPADDGFQEREEFYVGDWYRTWGTLLGNDSDDPVSYNTWSMVPGEQDDILSETPPDGRATLYYVLRDDRQGIDWWWFHVMVQ